MDNECKVCHGRGYDPRQNHLGNCFDDPCPRCHGTGLETTPEFTARELLILFGVERGVVSESGAAQMLGCGGIMQLRERMLQAEIVASRMELEKAKQ